MATVEKLIAGLQALHELDAAKGRLVGFGTAAIPTLRRYLIEGAPEVIFEPRRAAVEVLAELGAREALLDYLEHGRVIADPVKRLAEEAVENAAARAVARWRIPEVVDTLLRCARRGARAGVVEALASFDRPETIPYFIEALEDDLCAAAAAEALRRFGRPAEWPLLGAVRTPLPSAAGERPGSLRRRQAALGLLAELGPSPECWFWLRRSLRRSLRQTSQEGVDGLLVAGVARIAAAIGDSGDRTVAAELLIARLPTADWYAHMQIVDVLERLEPEAHACVDHAIAARSCRPAPVRDRDLTLRALLGVRRRWTLASTSRKEA